MSEKQLLSTLIAVESALDSFREAFAAYSHALTCENCNPKLNKVRKLMIGVVYRLLWAVIRLPKALLLSKEEETGDTTSGYITFDEFKAKFAGLSPANLAVLEGIFAKAPGGKILLREVSL